MPVLLFERGKLRGKRLNLPQQGTLRIGRDKQCQIRLPDKMISRLHCLLVGKDGQWRLDDCKSSNSTFINGKAVAQKKLASGDFIQVGDTIFSYYESSVDTLIGQTLKGYEVHQRIGRGGMGTVYLANQLSLQRQVALKLLNKDVAQKKDFVDRFLREARAAAQLNHPQVVQVYDTGEEDGNYFIAMEYLSGGSVETLMVKEGKLDPTRAVNIILEAFNAVSFAEKNKIVHRDIKPGNLLFSGEGHVKLADLGIALDLKDPEQVIAGTAAGSPSYMAPEQVQNRDIDHRADIYAMGATLYHMIAGVPPFESATVKEMLIKKLKSHPAPLKTLVPEVPQQLSNVVDDLLARHPDDRPGSAEEAQEALKAALHAPRLSRPHRRHTSPVVSRTKHKQAKPFPVGMVAGIIAVFVLAGIILVAMQNNDPEKQNNPGKRTVNGTPHTTQKTTPDRPTNTPNTPSRADILAQQERERQKAREAEEKRIAQEKDAARQEVAAIDQLLMANKLLEADMKITALANNIYAGDDLNRLKALLQTQAEKRIQAVRQPFEALCKAGSFGQAETMLAELSGQLPPTFLMALTPLKTMLAEFKQKSEEVLKALATLEAQAFEKMAGLDFTDLAAPFEGLAQSHPDLKPKIDAVFLLLNNISATWQALQTGMEARLKERKPMALRITSTPFAPAAMEGQAIQLVKQADHRFFFRTFEDKKSLHIRRILDIHPETLLAMAGTAGGLSAEAVKNALGHLVLLRCGPTAARPLVLQDGLPELVRLNNELKLTALKSLWFQTRLSELVNAMAGLETPRQQAKTPIEEWRYLAGEAASLIQAMTASKAGAPSAEAETETLETLKKLYTLARTQDLLTGNITGFFNAKTAKLSSRQQLELTYDFSTENQLKDFTSKGGSQTEITWDQDQKALSLRGEVRLLAGIPFQNYLSVTGIVMKSIDVAANMNIGLWTFPEDRLTPTFSDIDWRDLRNRQLGGVEADYVVCGMGCFLKIRGGGMAGQGLGRLVGQFRSMLPAYMREPAFVIFGGERGKTVGALDGELLWEMPAGEKALAPFNFTVGINKGDLVWTLNRRVMPLGKKRAELMRLKQTLAHQGSFTLFTNQNRVLLSSLKVVGQLREEWAQEQVNRRVLTELKTLGVQVTVPEDPEPQPPSQTTSRRGERNRPGRGR